MWASWRAAAFLLDCSVHPGIPVVKAFCTEVSMYPLASMKESHLCFVKTFPTQDVRAMGLKFPGSSGASLAVPLGIRRKLHFSRNLESNQMTSRSCTGYPGQEAVRGSASGLCRKSGQGGWERRISLNA